VRIRRPVGQDDPEVPQSLSGHRCSIANTLLADGDLDSIGFELEIVVSGVRPDRSPMFAFCFPRMPVIGERDISQAV